MHSYPDFRLACNALNRFPLQATFRRITPGVNPMEPHFVTLGDQCLKLFSNLRQIVALRPSARERALRADSGIDSSWDDKECRRIAIFDLAVTTKGPPEIPRRTQIDKGRENAALQFPTTCWKDFRPVQSLSSRADSRSIDKSKLPYDPSDGSGF